FTLDTPRTVGGFAPVGGKIVTKAATIAIQGTAATVCISSLSDTPIASSQRLLIMHLTDVQNNEVKYADQTRRVLLAWGKLPYLVRAGQATVTLRLAHPEKAKVWGMATDGSRTKPVVTRVENGALVIPLDVNDGGTARMYYEVEVLP
ncbi:MAG TPA: hypothetical protein VHV83_12415, partial [Armatimonadota bacterium]|nr:hypothetical protein [Armatimonadota bacterium]